MGYYISSLKSLPQIFNWYFFLVGERNRSSPVVEFFTTDFTRIAHALGERAAIVSFHSSIDEELMDRFAQGAFSSMSSSLSNLCYNTPGIVLMDDAAIHCIMDSYPLLKSQSMRGNVYFIPFEALEAAYDSPNTLYRDLIDFGRSRNMNFLTKTQNADISAWVQGRTKHFNDTWGQELVRKSHMSSHPVPEQNWDAEIHKKTMLALSTLVNNPRDREKHENDINDVVRDLLRMVYQVNDQTRSGYSVSEKGAGYLDFLIRDDNQLPIAIIEALAMDSLDRANLSLHIDKAITRYDPLGLSICSIVIYAKCKKFDAFWEKVMEFLNGVAMPYAKKQDFLPTGTQYASLHHGKMQLVRKGFPVNLHVYAVHICQPTAPQLEKDGTCGIFLC